MAFVINSLLVAMVLCWRLRGLCNEALHGSQLDTPFAMSLSFQGQVALDRLGMEDVQSIAR